MDLVLLPDDYAVCRLKAGTELPSELDVTAGPLPHADVAVANISLSLVETVLARVDAPLVVASGYLERDEPKAGPYRRRERRTLDGWAADVLERTE